MNTFSEYVSNSVCTISQNAKEPQPSCCTVLFMKKFPGWWASLLTQGLVRWGSSEESLQDKALFTRTIPCLRGKCQLFVFPGARAPTGRFQWVLITPWTSLTFICKPFTIIILINMSRYSKNQLTQCNLHSFCWALLVHLQDHTTKQQVRLQGTMQQRNATNNFENAAAWGSGCQKNQTW
jgi:hypothetical protein